MPGWKNSGATVSMVKLPLNQLIFTMSDGIHLAPSLCEAQSEPLPTFMIKFSNISPVPPISEIDPVISIGPNVPSDRIATVVDEESIDISRSAHT